MDARKLATATLFGVIIFVVRMVFPPPFSDLLLPVEALLLGLSFILLGRGGATYTELVNGLLASLFKASFFPFSLLLALLYGMLVDAFSTLFVVRSAGTIRAKRLVASLTLSSVLTGPIAYFATVFLTNLLPNDPSIYATIIIYGVFSGAIGGYLAVKIWERNLKARFKSVVPTSSA